jgi:FkbM family methyltransferase
MSDSAASIGSVPLGKRLAATVMRRLPTHIRRVRILRDGLYRALGGGGWDEDDALDATWPSAPIAPITGRVSGMKMMLNLSDWMERRAYFTGRYYQEDMEDLLTRLVRPGDNFVDVGGNIGLITLHASSLIGKSGTLWAFEPNPEVYDRLTRHADLNGIPRERIRNAGLGAEPGTLTMSIFGRHTGKATLVKREGPSVKSVAVAVLRGEEALSDLDAAKPTVIKIDVEGFEVSVLEGLGKILDGDVAVVIEVSRDWLAQAGSSVARLHAVLESHGLKAHGYGYRDTRSSRTLVVEPLAGPLDMEQYDAVFIRPGSIFVQRLGDALRA